ncbi:MAG: DNA polymerase I [Magnetococcus sp. DMHC-6]
MSNSRLFLIDGSGYFYQAFHGVRNLARRDGFPTNAIFGFIKMLRKVLLEHKPEYIAMIYDVRGPTFRHQLYDLYKAQRKPMPDDLVKQIPVIKQIVSAFNIIAFEQLGFEADDLIGTLAKQGEQSGLDVVIVTSDKDMMQLVSPKISILDGHKEQRQGLLEVKSKWGVSPARIPDLLALMGDTSDNIPGVPGIGEKSAVRLINEFDSLLQILDHPERISNTRWREKIITHQQQARLSLQLATIHCDVALEYTLENLKYRPPNIEALRLLYQEMEFSSFLRELPPAPTPVQPVTSADLTDPKAPPALLYHTLTQESPWRAFLTELSQKESFALDTETTDLDPLRAQLVGLSFAWTPREAFYIPLGHTLTAAPQGQLDLWQVLDALKPILENPKILKTGQNIKYDALVLSTYRIHLAGIERDTMLLSYLLHGNRRRHNLDTIALEELGRTTTTFASITGSGKQQIGFQQVPLEQAAPYACEDAEVAWEAAEKLHSQLQTIPKLARLYQEIERPLIPILAQMERTGALLDREELARLSADFNLRREALTQEIYELAGEPFNINSTQQLGKILFEKMAIKGGKRTKSGFSTDVSVLTLLAEQGYPMPQKVLHYRSLTKLQSTYTDALPHLIHPETGRVHTSYNQAVTLTGRLSSSDPNLQNIPIRSPEGRAIRAAFTAPKGWQLLSADYSQIELRLLAHVGQVSGLIDAFRQGLDIHSATAAELFGGHPEEIDQEARRMAKTINFGLIYGMSPYGLAKRLGISNPQARAYMERYFARYQGVQAWMNQAMAQAKEHGYAETLWGRRCPIPDINHSNRTLREIAERTAINAPLQGSAADLIKIAMIRLDQALKQENMQSRMILQVHDELVLEVPNGEMETIQPLIRTAMEGAAELSVPLKVDLGSGPNWALAH